ncbi:MAG: ZIP family metal transporter [Pseudomonadota bacterium]|uniref:ZIP family metal transporter n=1 Tax=Thermithiobacillus tepidarius TaxID=929 RepID=UPI00041EB599|nr:ZIP family metal transporter [Thermithiobacillus tepidarius]
MSLLLIVLLWSMAGGVLSVLAASIFLLLPEEGRRRLLPAMISYATGALLAGSLLGLIPEALEQAPVHEVLGAVLAGLLGFFILEKLVLWRHCHDDSCNTHSSAAPLILLGDGFHNFLDGVVIGAAFLTSVPLGIATTLAIIAHEIPQELGDFAILLHSGYSRAKALAFNLLSNTTTILGAVLAYYTLSAVQAAVPFVLAFSAAGFLYIAMADLIPGMHRETALTSTVQQILLILVGGVTIGMLRMHG